MRDRIAWYKKAPMPESVTDRATRSWEHIFILTKSERYWWDSTAVAEPSNVTANVVEYQHGKDMYEVSSSVRRDGVLPTTQPAITLFDMQEVRQGPGEGVAQDGGREIECAGGEPSLFTEPTRGNGASQDRTFGKEGGVQSPLLGECSRESQYPQGQYFTSGKGTTAPLLSRATHGGTATQYPDGGAVGGDNTAVQEPVHLLREQDETSEHGASNPPQQGRESHDGERSTRLPSVQFNSPKSPHASATSRNLRNVWHLGPEPFGWEMCESCGMIYDSGQYRRLPSIEYTETDEGTGEIETKVGKRCKKCGETKHFLSHFAIFPSSIPPKAILASCPDAICTVCGKLRERVVRKSGGTTGHSWHDHSNDLVQGQSQEHGLMSKGFKTDYQVESLGFTDCGHNAYQPGLVLDPFSGAGTTCLAAQQLGRRAVGVDLSEAYTRLAIKRLEAMPLPLGMTGG